MKEMVKGTKMYRKIRHEYKRFLAFMLSFMMFFTNVGNNVTVAFAANAVPTATAIFHLYGEDIREAAQEAIEGGDIFDLSSLEMNTKDATLMSKYERLLSDGYVYEIYPDIDDEAVPEGTELRTFIRVGNMEEEDYRITGDEEIIFLFINSSEQRVQFYADVDGYITSRVTVDGHMAAAQPPVEVIPPAVGPQPVPEETTAPEETTVPEESGTTVTPEETPAVPEETSEVPESSEVESTEADVENETEASTEAVENENTTVDGETADVPETTTASETEIKEPETEPETTEAVEPETEPETEETEPETTKAVVPEKTEENELTLSKSRNVVSIVAAPEGENAENAAEEAPAEEEAEPEQDAEEAGQEAGEADQEEEAGEADPEENAGQEPGTEAEPENGTEAEEPDESEEAKPEESSDTVEGTVSNEIVNTDSNDDSVTSEPEDETEDSADDPDDFILEEDKEYYDGIELIDDVTPIDEKLDDVNHGGSIGGTTYNQIELGGEAYARAFKTTLNALHINADVEGYSVNYMIDPLGGADIINKKSSVLEGESLSFGVRPQIGYEIDEVTSNGMSLDAVEEASASDASNIQYYMVDSITEDIDIEVTLIEVGEHPGLNESVTIKGVTITATAFPGIIPEGTKLDVKEVTYQLQDAVKEKIESETNGEKEVTSVLAYDINLIHNGKKLENDWATDDNYVKISFSGNRIEENSKEAETIEILHADVPEEETLTAARAASVTSSEIVLDDEGREAYDVAGEASIDVVDFKAKHFSIYIIVGTSDQKQNDVGTLRKGDSKVLYCDTTDGSNYGWSSSDTSYLRVSKNADGHSATITAIKAPGWPYTTTKTITCTYKTNSGSNRTEQFTVTIVPDNADKYTGYFYIRKPGTENDKTINYTNAWYYVDTVQSAIAGVPSPAASKTKYTDLSKVIKYPTRFPTIWYDGNGDGRLESYTYAKTGAVGTYSVEWGYIIDSSGANNGSSTITGNPAYHVDGFATLYIDNKVNVNFKTKNPGMDSYGLVLNYPKEKGTEYRYLQQPSYGTGEGQIQKLITYNGEEYEFDGWYFDEACTQKVSFNYNQTELNEDVTFYGQYVASQKATITYRVSPEGSGTLSSYSETLAPYNGAAKGSMATANDNYVFKEWRDVRGNKVSDNVIFVPAKSGQKWTDATYTAIFEAKTGILKYNLNSDKLVSNVTWEAPDGFTPTIPGKEYQDRLKYQRNDVAEVPGAEPKSKGYDFVNWNGNNTGTSDITAKAGGTIMYPSGNSLTLYAIWKPITYSITYETNGGTNPSANPSSYTVESPDITFEPATRDGYIFEGWYTDNATFKDEKSGINARSTGNVTVYAKWSADTSKLSVSGIEKVYDGNAYSVMVTGALTSDTVQYQEPNSSWTSEKPSYVNAGSYPVGVRVVRNGQEIWQDSATVLITKRPIVITVDSSEKFFNQPDPTFTGKITSGSLVDKDDLKTIKFERANKDVNDVGFYVGVLNAAYTANDNYDVTVNKGNFRIKTATDKDAKLEGAGGSWPYDGDAHAASAKVTGASGYTIEYKTEDGNWTTEAPTVTNVAEGHVKVSFRATKTGYTDLVAEDQYIYITEKPVTITVKDSKKVYNTPDPVFEGNVTGLVAPEKDPAGIGEVKYIRTNEKEDVGTYEDVLSATYTENKNYHVTIKTGTFKITAAKDDKAELEIIGGSKVYDGKALKVQMSTLDKIKYAIQNYTIWYTTDGGANWSKDVPSVTNVADGTVTVQAKGTRANYEDIISNEVTISITQRPVEITVADSSKPFASEDPAFPWSVTSNFKLVDRDDLGTIASHRIKLEGRDNEAVGTYEDVLTVTYTENDNYIVTVVPGDFEITKAVDANAKLSVTGGTWPYDGTEHNVTAEVTGAEGYTLYYHTGDGQWTETVPGVTTVGDGVKRVAVKAVKTGYVDLIGTAEIQIVPREVTITVENAWKYFDTEEPTFTGNITEGSLVSADDLGSIHYIRTNSDEAVGAYPDVLTAEYENNSNYHVTVEPGDFEIRTASIEGAALTAEGGSWVYDGEAHKASAKVEGAEGYTVYYKVGKDDWTTVAPSVTEVAEGTKTVSVKATRTGYTDLTADDVEISITARPVTIKVNEGSKFFNEQDPKFTGNVVAGTENQGLVRSDDLGEITYYRTNDAEAVDIYPGVLSARYTENKNYIVTVLPGDFEIKTATEAGAELTLNGGSWLYDGKIHEAEATVTGAKDYTIYYKVGDGEWTTDVPSVKDVRDGIKTVSVKATKTGYTDLTTESDTIQVTARKIVITVYNSEKFFDQKDPTFDGKITSGSLVKNDDLETIEFVRDNKEVNGVGFYEGVLNAAYTANDNYEVTVNKGNFTIKEATDLNAKLEGAGGSWPYDGDAHAASAKVTGASGYTIEYKTEDGNWTTEAPTVTNVAEGHVKVSFRATKTGYTDLVAEDQYIYITEKPVTITVKDSKKVYNTPDPVFEGNVTGLVAPEKDPAGIGEVKYIRTNEKEDVGTYEDVLSATYTENKNYHVTIKTGTFKITAAKDDKAELEIIGGSKVYDGKALKVQMSTLDKIKYAIQNYTIWYTTDGGANWSKDVPSVTNVADGTVTVQAKGTRANYEDIISNEVTISITQRPVEITVADSSKPFASEDPAFPWSVTSNFKLVDRDDLGTIASHRIKLEGRDNEAVGTYEDVLTVTYTENDNYIVTVVPGDFEITKAVDANAKLSVTGGTWPYDGTEHNVTAEVTGAEGYTLYYHTGDGQWTETVPGVTTVGDGVKRVAVKAVKTGYVDLIGTAEIQIVPREVTITVENAWKYFDTEEPTFTGNITEGSLVSADDLGSIHYIRTNSDEAVGAYPDVLTAEYENNSNYHVTVEPGDFEIRTASIEGAALTAEGGSWVYDGEAHKASAKVEGAEGYTVYYKVGKDDWTTVAPSVTEVAEGTKTVSVKATRTGYTDLTADDVEISITARPVTIKVNEGSKFFNEQDPKFTGNVVAGTENQGLVRSDDLGEITYYRTNDAEAVDIYPGVLSARYTENKNYIVTILPGNFEIKTATEAGAELTLKGGSWVYDGKIHEAEAKVTGAKDYTIYYKVGDGEWTTDVPSVKDVADGVKTVSVKATKTGYTDLTAEAQKIQVTARDIIITVEDSEKYFAQKDPDFTGGITTGKLVKNDDLGKLTFVRDNPQDEAVGTYENVLNAKYTANSNYNVTVNKGTFKILTASSEGVTLTAEGGSWTYDGKAHAVTAEVTGAEGYKIYYKVGDGEWTEEAPSVTNVNDGKKTVSVKAEKTGYESIEGEASIEITPMDLTIKVNNADKFFDEDDPAFTGEITVGYLVAEKDLGTITYERINDAEAVDYYKEVLDANYSANANYAVTVQRGDFEIKTAQIPGAVLTAAGGNWIYDGNAHTPIAEVSGAEGYQIYYKTSENDWTTELPSVTNVSEGTKVVSVKAVRTGYAELKADDVEISISARPVTIQVEGAWKYFDAEDPVFTGTILKGTEQSGLVNVSDLGTVEYYRTNDAEAVDIYKEVLSARYNPNSNYTVEVKKADFEIRTATDTNAKLILEGGNWIYDGKAHEASAEVTGADGYELYYKVGDGDWTVKVPSVTNVDDGVKTVSVKAVKTGYMDLTADEKTIQITSRPITITVDNARKYFDEEDPKFTGDITSGELVAKADLGTISYVRDNVDVEAVGTYPQVLNAAYIANNNYSVTVVKGEFVIMTATEAGAKLNLKGGSWVYDGEIHEAEATVTGAEDYTIYYKVGDGEWTTDVPSVKDVKDDVKTVSVKATKTGYTDLTADVQTIQVTARDIEITVIDSEKYFNQPDPIFIGEITKGELVDSDDLGTISYVRDNKEDEAVGTYENVLIAKYTTNSNYNVTVNKGTFKILTASSEGVTLTAEGGSWSYDGKAHAVTAEVTGAEGYKIYYKVGDGEWTEEAPSVTNVNDGKKTVSVKAEKTGYESIEGEAAIEITPMDLTIKVNNAEKFFDEKDPAFTGEITVGYLVAENDLGTISYERTNDAEEVNYYKEVLNANYSANANYTVTVQKGDFEIKTAQIPGAVLTAAGGNWIYDGNAHTPNAEVNGAEGYQIYYKTGENDWTTEIPNVTNVSEGTKVVSVKAVRTGYAELKADDVEISISARPVTIQVENAWKYFDAADPVFAGTILKGTEQSGVVNVGDLGTVEYYRTNDAEAVDIYKGVLSARFNPNSNYTVEVKKADFEIRTATDTKAKLILEGGSWIYDGKAHEAKAEVTGADGYKIYYKVGDGDWSVKVPSVTNVDDGVKTVSVKAVKTGYTDLTADEKTIQITSRPITITVDNSRKYFDEEDPEFTGKITSGELVNAADLGNIKFVRGNEGVEAVGTYPQVLNAAYIANSNYFVTVIKGDFVIETATEAGAKLTLNGGSWVYDGEIHEAESEVTGAKDYTIYYKVGDGEWTTDVPSVKDVEDGVKTVSVKATKTGYTDLTAEAQKIQVTAREIIITVDDSEKYFDQTDPDFTGNITTGELVNKDDLGNITFVRDNLQDEAVGIYENVLNAAYVANSNYLVTVKKGTFKILTASSEGVTLTAEGGSWTYDGNAHAVTAEVTGAEGYKIYYKVGDGEWTEEAPSVTNVNDGKKAVAVKAEKTGYESIEGEASIEITPMDLTIKVNNAEKFFDEKDPAFTGEITVGHLVSENDLGTISYERTNNAEAVDYYKEVLNANYSANANYAVTVQKGDFEIKTAQIPGAVLVASGGNWIYDGNAHTTSAEVNGAEGYQIYYKTGENDWTTEIPNVTNVSEGTKVVSVKAVRTGYEELKADDVEISISARPVAIQVEDAWKYFDSADPAFTGTIVKDSEHEGLVNDGDLGTISYYRTNDAEAVDIYNDVLSANFSPNANYTVTVLKGDFEIRTATDESAVLNVEGGIWPYDGNAHTANAEVTGADGYTIYYKVGENDWTTEGPSVTNVEEGAKTVSVKAVRTGYTDLTADDVTIQIVPREVTITVDSFTKIYGSQDPEFTGIVTELVKDGDLGEIKFQRLEPGKENVGDDIALTAVYTANSNYNVTVIPGKLNIIASTENAVNVSSQTVTYDGTSYGLKNAEVLREGSTLLYSTDNQNFSSSAPVFTEAGNYTVYVKATNPNYEETGVVSGTVIINKRPITITAGSASKRYDGSPVTNTSAELTSGSLAKGQSLVDVDVTGSQTTVGTSSNIPSNAVIMANGKDVTGNYAVTYVNGTLTITSRSSSGGGGGNGGGTTPGYGNGGDTGNGPGETTINPTDVPLANLPNDITTGENILIDDGEIPLAALPKTGNQAGMNAVLAMLSGMLLAAYLTIAKKKDEES